MAQGPDCVSGLPDPLMQRPVKPAHMNMQGMRLTGRAGLCRAARSDAEALRQRVGTLTLENRELRARLGEPTDGQCCG